jgi:hypothetical protein
VQHVWLRRMVMFAVASWRLSAPTSSRWTGRCRKLLPRFSAKETIRCVGMLYALRWHLRLSKACNSSRPKILLKEMALVRERVGWGWDISIQLQLIGATSA